MGLHTAWGDPLHRIRYVPNPRQITSRSSGCFLPLRWFWLRWRSGLRAHDGRERQYRNDSVELLREHGLTVRTGLLHGPLLTISNLYPARSNRPWQEHLVPRSTLSAFAHWEAQLSRVARPVRHYWRAAR